MNEMGLNRFIFRFYFPAYDSSKLIEIETEYRK